jgi:hypothetical protein
MDGKTAPKEVLKPLTASATMELEILIVAADDVSFQDATADVEDAIDGFRERFMGSFR